MQLKPSNDRVQEIGDRAQEIRWPAPATTLAWLEPQITDEDPDSCVGGMAEPGGMSEGLMLCHASLALGTLLASFRAACKTMNARTNRPGLASSAGKMARQNDRGLSPGVGVSAQPGRTS